MMMKRSILQRTEDDSFLLINADAYSIRRSSMHRQSLVFFLAGEYVSEQPDQAQRQHHGCDKQHQFESSIVGIRQRPHILGCKTNALLQYH